MDTAREQGCCTGTLLITTYSISTPDEGQYSSSIPQCCIVFLCEVAAQVVRQAKDALSIERLFHLLQWEVEGSKAEAAFVGQAGKIRTTSDETSAVWVKTLGTSRPGRSDNFSRDVIGLYI